MTHHVYVVELDRAVLKSRRFREANPQHDPRKPCVYVGVTGLTPEERFRRHKEGVQASRIVTKYGVRLRRRLFSHYGPLPYDRAAALEVRLAERLRRRGYAVWQH
jgi:hypothetical protein